MSIQQPIVSKCRHALTIFCHAKYFNFFYTKDILTCTNVVSPFFLTFGLKTLALKPCVLKDLNPNQNTFTQEALYLFLSCRKAFTVQYPRLFSPIIWRFQYIELPSNAVFLQLTAGGDRSLEILHDVSIMGSVNEEGKPDTELHGNISISGNRTVRLANVSLRNKTGTGICLTYQSQLIANNVIIHSCCLSALHLTGGSEVSITNSQLFKNGRNGLCLREGSKCYLQNTFVEKNQSDGVVAHGSNEGEGSVIHIQLPEIFSDAWNEKVNNNARKAVVRENKGRGIFASKNAHIVLHYPLSKLIKVKRSKYEKERNMFLDNDRSGQQMDSIITKTVSDNNKRNDISGRMYPSHHSIKTFIGNSTIFSKPSKGNKKKSAVGEKRRRE
jgi:hypothetical protein